MAGNLLTHLTTLARERHPYTSPEALRETADYLTQQFTDAGLSVTRHSFNAWGQTYDNVVAAMPASTGTSKAPLILAAHYDTVEGSPGADDNASGVAGLLGMARTLARRPLDRTVRFVAFGFEEPPAYRTKHMGSYHYAKGLHDRKEQVEGMVCLEMIGFFSDRRGSQHYPLPFMSRTFPKKGDYIALVGNRRSRPFTIAMANAFRAATDLSLITLNAPAIVVGIDFSDHWSFNKFGIPAFMVTDTAFYRNPHYHAPTDLPDTLDYIRMAKVVEGLTAGVQEWGTER